MASVVEWSEYLAADSEVLDSIPGDTRLSEQQWVWNGVHSASSGRSVGIARLQTKRHESFINYVIFEVFTAVTMKNAVLWDVMPLHT
jgi:hypothetical protein